MIRQERCFLRGPLRPRDDLLKLIRKIATTPKKNRSILREKVTVLKVNPALAAIKIEHPGTVRIEGIIRKRAHL